jgi:curved DNA-binding protein CbpA
MSLYDELEVSPNASAEVIQAAYRSLAKRYHPDRNPGDASAADRMRRVNDANAVLSDPEKRARYDATQRSARSNEQRASQDKRGNGPERERDGREPRAARPEPGKARTAPAEPSTSARNHGTQRPASPQHLPGWYSDPWAPYNPMQMRWWDGRAWTEELSFGRSETGKASESQAGSLPSALRIVRLGMVVGIAMLLRVWVGTCLGPSHPSVQPEPPPSLPVQATNFPPAPAGPIILPYTVRDGDSWYGIAAKVDVDPYDLCAVNGASFRTPLFPGQVLNVPLRSTRPASSSSH